MSSLRQKKRNETVVRRGGLLVLAGVLSLAVLAGCATQGQSSLREILRKEGFNLSGRSETPLHSILMVFRDLEADDRPF